MGAPLQIVRRDAGALQTFLRPGAPERPGPAAAASANNVALFVKDVEEVLARTLKPHPAITCAAWLAARASALLLWPGRMLTAWFPAVLCAAPEQLGGRCGGQGRR